MGKLHKFLVTMIVVVVSATPSRVATADNRTVFRLGGYDAALLDAERLDIEISFALILNQILEQMDARADFTVYDTFDEVSELFRSGTIEGMFCSIGDCPKLLSFNEGLPMYSLLYNGAPTQEYVLVTSISHEAKGLNSLRGKTFGVPFGHALGERIANTYIAEQTGQNIGEFFGSIARPDSSQSALIDLVFGKVDIAIVTKNELGIAIDLNPQMASSLTTLYVSPPVVLNLMVLSPKTGPDYRALFRHVTANLSEYSQSRHMLALYGADGIAPLAPEDIAATLAFFR